MITHIRQLHVLLCFVLLLAFSGCAVDNQPLVASQPSSQASVGATVVSPPTPTFVPLDSTAPNRSLDSASGSAVELDDTVWQGGYRRSSGVTRYGGRTATWIYGIGTDFSAMRAEFEVQEQPTGTAELRIEGMDSEDRAKTPISIAINGTEIFNDPNPLPNDDFNLDTGTWTTAAFPFDAQLLRLGANEIQIRTLVQGQFSRPPFFMLDYAEISYETQ